jgi:polyhydroxybutyrate depolymerase
VKRKIFNVLFALVLMLSFSVMTAAPAIAAGPTNVVSVVANGNTSVTVTFSAPITAGQAGPISYNVTFNGPVKGTATGTAVEGATTAVLTLTPPLTPQGVYRLVVQAPSNTPRFFVGEGQLITTGFEFGGYNRTYELYIPSTYDGSTAVPLIFSFHGRSLTGAAMINYTGFTDVAESEGFIAVFPDSTRLMDPLGICKDLYLGKFTEASFGPQWSTGKDMTFQDRYGVDDVPFVTELLDRLETGYNIDETRVYATGWSSGGMFVSQLAVKLSDRFAAIVSASGGLLLYEELPYIPKTYISTVGALEDESVRPAPAFTSAATAEFWANVDNCGPGVVYENDKYIRTTYSGGIWGTESILYVVKGQGHAWPNQPGGLDGPTIWGLLEGQTLTPQAMIASAIGNLDITDLPEATKTSLTTSLDTAMKKLNDSNQKNNVAAKNAMNAFINKVEAQRGKKIPVDLADQLIARAQRIIVVISGGT